MTTFTYCLIQGVSEEIEELKIQNENYRNVIRKMREEMELLTTEMV